MPYSYTLSTVIPASPAEIYRAWLDSILHAEMTGGEANMSEEVGAEVSAWDGYITGRNLELIADERIVQAWRTTEFDDAFEDSIVTILLQETEDGTLLTLEHSNVPDAQRSYEEGGWQSNYFEPMIAYFAGLRGQALVEPDADAEAALPPEGAMSAPAPAPKSAGRRHKASAGPQRRVAASARKTKPVAAKKKKATERSAKAGKKASSGPAKRAAKKSSTKAAAKTSAKTSAKSSAKRGGAKKAARASSLRRKSARGRR